MADALTMIASDGILPEGIGHPRVAGAFARVLGHHARDVGALRLMDALCEMTIEPARRVEHREISRAPGSRSTPVTPVAADA